MFEVISNLLNGSSPSAMKVGLYWFFIDLALSACLFVSLERAFALHKNQKVLRPEWQIDLSYFAVNHLSIALLLIPANVVAQAMLSGGEQGLVQEWIGNLPFPVALLLIVLVADLIQYWVHRMYHQIPTLWRFHAVHHSTTTLDWLSGSRQHLLELCLTRTLLLAPFIVLGFAPAVVNTFIVIGGLQAVFNHSNINARLGWLRFIVVTPNFHHWHHSRQPVAINRNYAAHFSFLDYLFHTAIQTDDLWPTQYGLRNEEFPSGMVQQFVFPFTKKGESSTL